MKKTLYFVAALTLAASTAMASKARLSALGSAQVIMDTDVQGIFMNPSYMHYVGDFVTFEMGTTPNSAATAVDGTPNPEAGFINAVGDAKFGIYLGRMSTDTNAFRAKAAAVGNFLEQENPVELFYGAKAGDLNWGASFSFSNSDKKNTAVTTDDQKQNAMGLRMGVRTDDWSAFANVGLGAKATEGDAEVKGTTSLLLGGQYNMDNQKAYVQYATAGAKATLASGTEAFDATVATTSIGYNNSWKADGSIAFYGVEYQMINNVTKKAAGDDKTVGSRLPFTIGAEVAAASWMKLRGSVSQNLLIGSTKETTNGTAGETNTVTHNTTTAAGAGFVWGHNTLDIVMTMGTDGKVDSTAFGSNASYTYLF